MPAYSDDDEAVATTPRESPPLSTPPSQRLSNMKLDPKLLVTDSAMYGAIPVLPLPVAVVCFFFNVFAPGLGTVLSGFFGLCCGHTRFSQKDDFDNLAGSLFMNIFVGVAQFCTVVLCLVGWCWSIGWGVTMISIAKQNRDFLESIRTPPPLDTPSDGGSGSNTRGGTAISSNGIGVSGYAETRAAAAAGATASTASAASEASLATTASEDKDSVV